MRVPVFVLAALAASAAYAWPTPQQAINEFLKFELAGGRLAAWPLGKYLAVGSDYEESGWDVVHLVQDAKVKSLACAQARCVAEVQFSYVPTATLRAEQLVAHPTGGTETVRYVVVQVGQAWLLESANGIPRLALAEYKRRFPDGL
jgi:hypothetical protein